MEKRDREEHEGQPLKLHISQSVRGGFQQCYVLKTFPSTLKNEENGRKKGKRKKKDAQGREELIFKGAGEGFQQCYALKTLPGTLKNEGKGRKR